MNSLRFHILFVSFIMFQLSTYGMVERVRFADADDFAGADDLEIDEPWQAQLENLKKAFSRPTFDENGSYCGNLDDPHEGISEAELKEIEALLAGQSRVEELVRKFEHVSHDPVSAYNLPIVLEGFSRDARIKLAKLLAARAQCKYKYIDADLLYTGERYSEAHFLRESIYPLILQANPCIVILDRFMSLVKQKGNEGFTQPLAVATLCDHLDDFKDHKSLFFIGLRGDTSDMPPRLHGRLWRRVHLSDPNESIWQTMYNYLFKQPTDS